MSKLVSLGFGGVLLCLVAGRALAAPAAAAPAKPAAGAAPAKAAVAKVSLDNSDCVKCHDKPPADLTSSGGKHLEVNCTGCHESHRPASKSNIPDCATCHSGGNHFKLKGCLGCHQNPHTPLNIKLAAGMVDPCLTCHDQQIVQLRDNKSKHTAQSCTTCHSVHRQVPPCLQCHKAHSAETTADTCKSCHKAHMPTKVAYATVPNGYCSGCHKKAVDTLAASTTKHHALACSFCHKEKHKAVPQCLNCHQPKHPAGMLAKFPKCGDCHSTAHDLNNFKAAAPAPGKKI